MTTGHKQCAGPDSRRDEHPPPFGHLPQIFQPRPIAVHDVVWQREPGLFCHVVTNNEFFGRLIRVQASFNPATAES